MNWRQFVVWRAGGICGVLTMAVVEPSVLCYQLPCDGSSELHCGLKVIRYFSESGHPLRDAASCALEGTNSATS
ncbi:hypothetical protein C8R47DRAFT_9647 [Mycena vitilis]|nr:hypothetical protein C8R47DRAFT_9647 [Mycena vitilis]